MNEECWERLVRRLERRAHEDPGGYRRRVLAVTALGYAYLALVLLALAALAGVAVWLVIHHPGPLIKLLFPILVVAWIVVRPLTVRIEPPGGVPLRREDAPELFRALKEVNGKVHGPKLGGFNWSLQHLVMEVVHDGCWQASAGDSCDAWPDVVAGPAVGGAA